MRIIRPIRYVPVILLALSVRLLIAQGRDFDFGKPAIEDLSMTRYEHDTSASAVVLHEFGEAYFDAAHDYALIFTRHLKIKILKEEGFNQANIDVRLLRWKDRREELFDVKAVTFNMGNGQSIESTPFDGKIYTEDQNDRVSFKKFTLPNVRVGSVIEFTYKVLSTSFYNFRRWPFQSSIPKVRTEFWATIPGNYVYNVTLRGFQKLSVNNSEIIKSCIDWGSAGVSDCARYHFAMRDVPAFIEEDYMTAAVNFISAIDFELSEVRYFDGRVDKITREWKDVEGELRSDSQFGSQLKKGKDIGKILAPQLAGERDSLTRARIIFDFIKSWYTWNGFYSFYSEPGIKKAFDSKSGSIGDINLSLIATLIDAGFEAEPVLLSTRDNGLPGQVHPVISDFNYVIGKITLGGKVYLLDASDKNLPFGLIPERCLNGQGRAFGNKGSYWVNLTPTGNGRKTTIMKASLDPSGTLKGSVSNFYYDYAAYDRRREIQSFSTEEDYIKELEENLQLGRIAGYKSENLLDPYKPLSEEFQFEHENYESLEGSTVILNPFFVGRIERNPFRSIERLYPVDLGAPMERTVSIEITFPPEFHIVDVPDRVAVALPKNGGRFVLESSVDGNTLRLTYALALAHPIYTATEYHYLKELYTHAIQAQGASLLLTRSAP